MDKLLNLLCENMNSDHPVIRKVLLGWLEVLSHIPNVNLLNKMPIILPKLITYIADPDEKIRDGTRKQLSDFLTEYSGIGPTREAVMDEEILHTLMKYFIQNEYKTNIL